VAAPLSYESLVDDHLWCSERMAARERELGTYFPYLSRHFAVPLRTIFFYSPKLKRLTHIKSVEKYHNV
jgi:hypothetical protein